jgi:hypothetical protein
VTYLTQALSRLGHWCVAAGRLEFCSSGCDVVCTTEVERLLPPPPFNALAKRMVIDGAPAGAAEDRYERWSDTR